jgi:hypothetical protein
MLGHSQLEQQVRVATIWPEPTGLPQFSACKRNCCTATMSLHCASKLITSARRLTNTTYPYPCPCPAGRPAGGGTGPKRPLAPRIHRLGQGGGARLVARPHRAPPRCASRGGRAAWWHHAGVCLHPCGVLHRAGHPWRGGGAHGHHGGSAGSHMQGAGHTWVPAAACLACWSATVLPAGCCVWHTLVC